MTIAVPVRRSMLATKEPFRGVKIQDCTHLAQRKPAVNRKGPMRRNKPVDAKELFHWETEGNAKLPGWLEYPGFVCAPVLSNFTMRVPQDKESNKPTNSLSLGR